MEHLAHVGAQRGTLEKLFGREIGQFGHIVHTDYLKALAAENLEFAAYPLVFCKNVDKFGDTEINTVVVAHIIWFRFGICGNIHHCATETFASGVHVGI